jgi:hypothetical protein
MYFVYVSIDFTCFFGLSKYYPSLPPLLPYTCLKHTYIQLLYRCDEERLDD